MTRTNLENLLYRPDADKVRRRVAAWWRGEDIGRPLMQICVPRTEPPEDIPEMDPPEGCCPQYTTQSIEYRVNHACRHAARDHYLGEGMPNVRPCLGPNCLALYLGCSAMETSETVWFNPCIHDSEEARFEVEPDNFYWDFQLRLVQRLVKAGEGRFLTEFPDLVEGLDTLAAMRGDSELLMDMMDRPEWVKDSLKRITQRYFECYDVLYDMVRDNTGGSHWWLWAPGRLAKLQCDISAMISPEMFGEFMVPVLREMTGKLDYSFYHWDGVGALPHHDHLLSLPDLDMIQWTPGAGKEDILDPRWWPLYHKTIEAGKRVFIGGPVTADQLSAMRREFGAKLNHFAMSMGAETHEEANTFLKKVSA